MKISIYFLLGLAMVLFKAFGAATYSWWIATIFWWGPLAVVASIIGLAMLVGLFVFVFMFIWFLIESR